MQIQDHKRWLTLPAIALSALALGACGDDDESDSSSNGAQDTTAAEQAPADTGASEASTLKIDATEQGGQLGFSKEKLTAKAGEVTITMRNPAGNQAPHAIEVEGNGIEEEGDTVQPGSETSTVTTDLEPGKYTFYCPVGNHEQAGMKGTLTVR